MLEVVADILRRRRAKGWLVGGSVRDCELGRGSPDLDVVVADDPAAITREVASRLAAPWFVLSARHGAYRVVGREGHVDIAAVRGAGIVDDLAQRDFTINAMAASLETGSVVDPFRGLEHLRQGRLVAVSERIFEDDSLRLMRAPRFSHLLDLRLDPPLEALIRTQAPALSRAAPERVATEIALTFAAGRSAAAALLWQRLGLLGIVLPEVMVAERFKAALPVLERLDEAMAQPEARFPQSAIALANRLARPIDGAVSRAVALRLAGLMHRVPASYAVAAGRRLKLSAAAVSLLGTVSGCFDQGGCGADGLREAVLSARSAVLFLWQAAPWEPEVILVAWAAATVGSAVAGAPAPHAANSRKVAIGAGARTAGASAAGAPATGSSTGQAAAQCLMSLWADRDRNGVPRPPVDGEVLMRELGLAGGPVLGKVLREVRLAWEAGESTSASDALAVARAAVGSS